MLIKIVAYFILTLFLGCATQTIDNISFKVDRIDSKEEWVRVSIIINSGNSQDVYTIHSDGWVRLSRFKNKSLEYSKTSAYTRTVAEQVNELVRLVKNSSEREHIKRGKVIIKVSDSILDRKEKTLVLDSVAQVQNLERLIKLIQKELELAI